MAHIVKYYDDMKRGLANIHREAIAHGAASEESTLDRSLEPTLVGDSDNPLVSLTRPTVPPAPQSAAGLKKR